MDGFSSIDESMNIRRIVLRLIAYIVFLALAIWATAGFFMSGQDKLGNTIPLIVVLGGGVAGERLQVACNLFSQGHGQEGVILTGGNQEYFIKNRSAFLKNCGIPKMKIINWPKTTNSFEEMQAIGKLISTNSNIEIIVVSDALHMPRLRYLRGKFGLKNKVFFRESKFSHKLSIAHMFRMLVFWFREPLAYFYYQIKY